MSTELSHSSQWKKQRRKRGGGVVEKSREGKGVGGKTEASTEVRDEKGKILFSFHVIKYLLCFHMSPTDRHSGLKEHYRDCWTATQSYWPRPSLLRTRLRCTALTVWDTCTNVDTTRGEKQKWAHRNGSGRRKKESMIIEDRQFHCSFKALNYICVCLCVCVQEHEVRAKIFKAFGVHYSVTSLGRRVSTCSQANHHLP